MKELIQQKVWLPDRGIEMLLPPRYSPISEAEPTREKNERLLQISNDGPLRKRYPSPEAGLKFMQTVDFDRRNYLLRLAQSATEKIVDEWKKINSETEIAVIVFGSVAKGLVKKNDDPDPSNIDMSVIGNISDSDRDKLYDAIRPYRKSVQEDILGTSGEVNSPEKNPGNLGICIQHTDKLTNGHFSAMAGYIGSGAFPIYDPSNIWGDLEKNALSRLADCREKSKGTQHEELNLAGEDPLPLQGDIYTQLKLLLVT